MPASDSDVVEETKAHWRGRNSVVARWPHEAVGAVEVSAYDGLSGANDRAGSSHRGIEGASVGDGIGQDHDRAAHAETLHALDVIDAVDARELLDGGIAHVWTFQLRHQTGRLDQL